MAERLNQAPPEEGEGQKHIPLVQPINTRDGTLAKDSKMVNCYVELTALGPIAVKRPGLRLITQNEPGIAQGQFLLSGVPHAVLNDRIYPSQSNIFAALPGIAYPGELLSFLSDVPFGNSFAKSSTAMWLIQNELPVALITKVTTSTFPVTTAPGIAYLGGTFFVLDVNGDLRGSVIENPLVWPALNFVGIDPSLGAARGISRHLNYIAAFAANGVQMYYNAGTANGTPLLPVGNASWGIGCANGFSILNINDETFFIAESGAKGRSIQKISGLNMTRISTPNIEKILARDALSYVQASDLRINGHSFYALTLSNTGTTLIYDTVLEHWTVWGTALDDDTDTSFNGVFSITRGDLCLVQGQSDGKVYALDSDTFTDNGVQINMRVVSPYYGWGTMQRKFMPDLFLIADTVQSMIRVRYSDDDYNTFSAWRQINLATERKQALRMGSAIRRSWEILHTANTAFRGEKLQIGILRGAT